MGNRVGAAGRIRMLPRQYDSPYALDLSTAYCMQYYLKDKTGKVIGESISEPTNNKLFVENPQQISWKSIKDIPLNDMNDAVTLQVNLVAEP